MADYYRAMIENGSHCRVWLSCQLEYRAEYNPAGIQQQYLHSRATYRANLLLSYDSITVLQFHSIALSVSPVVTHSCASSQMKGGK